MLVPLTVLLSLINCIGLQLLTDSTDAAAVSQLRVLPVATADSPNATSRPQGASSSYARVHDFPPTGSKIKSMPRSPTIARACSAKSRLESSTWWHPCCFKNSCLETEALPKIVHSRVLAICIAASPTPPAADKIKTLDLRRRCPVKSIVL